LAADCGNAYAGGSLRIRKRHGLAFADHAAEFYASSGNDCRRALDLACLNVANRPTLRAFERAHAVALSTADTDAASQLLADATDRCGGTAAFLGRAECPGCRQAAVRPDLEGFFPLQC